MIHTIVQYCLCAGFAGYARISSHCSSSRISNQCTPRRLAPAALAASCLAQSIPRTSLARLTFPIPKLFCNFPKKRRTSFLWAWVSLSQPAMKRGNVRAEYSQWSSSGNVSTRDRQRYTAVGLGVETRGVQSRKYGVFAVSDWVVCLVPVPSLV